MPDELELSPQNRVAIQVDRALCIGSGDCVDTAPDVFQLDEEDKAVVVDPDGAAVDDIITAASNCPVSAIFVVGEDGDLYP
jgi:ferredoxin